MQWSEFVAKAGERIEDFKNSHGQQLVAAAALGFFLGYLLG